MPGRDVPGTPDHRPVACQAMAARPGRWCAPDSPARLQQVSAVEQGKRDHGGEERGQREDDQGHNHVGAWLWRLMPSAHHAPRAKLRRSHRAAGTGGRAPGPAMGRSWPGPGPAEQAGSCIVTRTRSHSRPPATGLPQASGPNPAPPAALGARHHLPQLMLQFRQRRGVQPPRAAAFEPRMGGEPSALAGPDRANGPIREGRLEPGELTRRGAAHH